MEAAFTELIEPGKSKGRLRCAMCTAVEQKYVPVRFQVEPVTPPALVEVPPEPEEPRQESWDM